MSTNLFYVDGSKACEASQSFYEKEYDLQKLVADNPNLLLRSSEKGNINLMLVKQEQTVKESADGTKAYSLDHLMVDTDGVPVLVEVKRSTDTRIRREVVGQMIDYAARASLWDINDLREQFNSITPEDVRENFDDAFWDTVATNLKAERMKLVFVADYIPPSLRTLIEFMSRNLNDIDVYGVEIVRYKSGETTFLTTDTVEYAVKAERRAAVAEANQWTEDSLADLIIKRTGSTASVAAMREIVAHCTSLGFDCRFGIGAKNGSFIVSKDGTTMFQLGVYAKAIIEMKFSRVAAVAGDDWVEHIRKCLDADGNPLFRLTPEYLHIDLRLLEDSSKINGFKEFVQWYGFMAQNKKSTVE